MKTNLLTLLSALTFMTSSTLIVAGQQDYKIDVWVDNWFSAYLEGSPLLEDSVSINTERSFNAETQRFSATTPFVLAFVLKDFKQNDTGLEYIGSRRQQIGDGGFITQITQLSNNAVIAVSSDKMRCKVIHKAPLERSCAKQKRPVAGQGACQFTRTAQPEGWKVAGFDDSAWPLATEYSAAQVQPKQGYDKIDWDNSAKLIWSDDLEKDNTLLCRLTVGEAKYTSSAIHDTLEPHTHFAHFSNVETSKSGAYLHIASNGLPEHNMMQGISNWQQQVPLPQQYSGANSWQIPLEPVLADKPLLTKAHFHKGAIAIAVNGVPIFNALNNRGEYAADIGELDLWGGHSGKADDYHYHLAPEHLEKIVGKGQPIAYALDGFAVYGKTTKTLDQYLGRFNEKGTYQYHATDYPPYLIAGLRGVVKTDSAANAPEDQIVPQPRSQPIRSNDYGPLKGAVITGFKQNSNHSYTLNYEVKGIAKSIKYSWDNNHQYLFTYSDGNGQLRTENYSLNTQSASAFNHKSSKKRPTTNDTFSDHKTRKYCGDNICDNTENANSCAVDC